MNDLIAFCAVFFGAVWRPYNMAPNDLRCVETIQHGTERLAEIEDEGQAEQAVEIEDEGQAAEQAVEIEDEGQA